MKTISIYWNNDSDELRLLPECRVVACGGDGMEVLGTDSEIDKLVEAVRSMPEHFTFDGPTEAKAYDFTNAVEISRGNWPEFGSEAEVRAYLES